MRTGPLFVPEVVQTSALDCGPACLKAVLEAHGVPVNYDRLREACRTSRDGTSINTLEQVANELGVDAEQIMVPVDHVLIPEANVGPAIVVIKLPNAFTHFVVLWRKHGRVVQLMDPAVGRLWPRTQSFVDEIYVHRHPVPAEGWREWVDSKEFRGALEHRARAIGISPKTIASILRLASADPTWQSFAVLDAAVRMMTPLVRSGSLGGSHAANKLLRQLLERATAKGSNAFEVIPPSYWSVLPVQSEGGGPQVLAFQGAVVLRIRARARSERTSATANPQHGESIRDVAKGLCAPAVNPLLHLLRTMRADGLLSHAAIGMGLGLSTCGMLFEVVLYRTFVDLGRFLAIPQQRQIAVIMLAGFFVALLALDWCLTKGILRLGRNLELRLRTHILEKLPRLADHYLSSRLISDLAERAHAIQEIRGVPAMGMRMISSVFELVLTTAGVVWLDPRTLIPALACGVTGVLLPFLIQPVAAERDLRFRTHSGALCRFYFDALRGLVPVWTHKADDAIRTEHESLLVNWLRAALSLQRIAVALAGVGGLVGFGFTLWLLITHFRGGEASVSLLLVYWALNLPAIAGQVGSIAMQYPRQRNLMLRVLEPLNAPESEEAAAPAAKPVPVSSVAKQSRGFSISFDKVSIAAGGQTILDDCNIDIRPGAHVCIVGPSGAGKSSLVGILLGWHRPTTGQVLVDGEPLDESRLETLRKQTAWVDPSIQIWNRSLLKNLQYGGGAGDSLSRISEVLDRADLIPVLTRLPKGLQTNLGEGGALVSGGEGQRVRLGRAMLKQSPRLVILDEPFTALDRERRRELLRDVRKLWKDATLLCITHDVSESLEFERVLVVDHGRIVESGSPKELLHTPASRYKELLSADESVDKRVWSRTAWRRVYLERGQVSDNGRQTYDRRFEISMLAEDAVKRSPGRVGPQVFTPSERE